MLQSRREFSLEEVSCAFGRDGDVVWIIKEQHSRLASYSGVEGSAVIEVLRRKEDKACLLFRRGGVCGSEQVQVD